MSYFTTLSLEREPFSISPDPAFFYRSMGHYTALNRLEIAIRLKKGLSVVLGDVGIGKTTLSRALLQSFHEEDHYVFHLILDPAYKTEHEFLSHLTRIFGVTPFFQSSFDHREAIERYLFRKAVDEHRTVVLLIDEGQKLQPECLEVLRTLLNYETNEYKMLQLVILGQMEMLPRVRSMPNFMDRVSLQHIIKPLDEYETGEMIRFRLQQAGYRGARELFTYEAVRKIYTHTQGYPRRIAKLCHSAMEHLVMENYETVTADLVDRIRFREQAWR